MTYNDVDSKAQHIDSGSHELTPAQSEHLSTPPKWRTQRSSPWWAPLLAPAVMTVLFVMASLGDHGQPQTQRFTLAGDTFAWLFLLATLAVPAFFAGVRYNRQRGDRDPR